MKNTGRKRITLYKFSTKNLEILYWGKMHLLNI